MINLFRIIQSEGFKISISALFESKKISGPDPDLFKEGDRYTTYFYSEYGCALSFISGTLRDDHLLISKIEWTGFDSDKRIENLLYLLEKSSGSMTAIVSFEDGKTKLFKFNEGRFTSLDLAYELHKKTVDLSSIRIEQDKLTRHAIAEELAAKQYLRSSQIALNCTTGLSTAQPRKPTLDDLWEAYNGDPEEMHWPVLSAIVRGALDELIIDASNGNAPLQAQFLLLKVACQVCLFKHSEHTYSIRFVAPEGISHGTEDVDVLHRVFALSQDNLKRFIKARLDASQQSFGLDLVTTGFHLSSIQ